MELLLQALEKAEKAINQRYLDGWLRAINNPEEYRLRGAVTREAFASIRGELTNG